MFGKQVVLLLFLPFCLTKSVEVTFKDVTFRGYSVFTEKFKKVIPLGKSLKDFLPDSIYDEIEMREQNIPVLYKGSLADLDKLDELVIEFCNVEEIQPGAISNAPMLRKISLKGNKLKSIEFGVFNNLQAAALELSLNQITAIDSQAFDDMPNLLMISLADNNIKAWNPEWFKNTPLLTRISMQNNSIEEIPPNAFKNLKGEKKYGKVDLTLNLVFSHNAISKIDPKAFEDLDKINNLWLDNNVLEDFDEHILENVQVDDLRLNKNNIKCFNGDMDKILKANTNHVDSNPFDCDCLEKLKNWSKKKKNVEFLYAEMECTAQRIRTKMTALEKRLKEIKTQNPKSDIVPDDDDEEVEVFEPKKVSIK